MALIIVVAIVFAAVGFFAGQVVQAVGFTAGSEEDPLVLQSYVEQVVGKEVSELQAKVDTLQAEIDALKAGGSSSASGNTSGNSGGTSNSGSSENSGSSTNSGTTGKTLTVVGSSVNIRSGAGTSYSVVAGAKKGQTLTCIGESGDWYQVQLSDGTKGWVSSSLVKVN